jgi:hypothetical protein
MRPPKFHAASIEQYLTEKKYATLDELKDITGTSVSMTVFRKLKQLSYISSCSHRGKYYSLERIAAFDESGIWRPDGILFSRFGTLLDTVEHFVCQSAAGYTSIELRKILSIEVKEQLLQLWVETRLSREMFDGLYVYTSAESTRKHKQLTARRQQASRDIGSSSIEQEVKAAIILFYSMLDEKQRRIYAGLESIKHGHGGDAIIARLLDVDVHTVAKGRRQLLESDIEVERVRRAGAGRTSIKKKPRGNRCNRANHET